MLLGAVTGCEGFSEPVAVSVKNDLARPVTLAICDSSNCSKRIDPWTLKPGETGSVTVEINGGYGPAIILAPDGSVLGCLPFRMSKRPSSSVTVLVSQAVACGSSSGENAARGKDWPDPSL